MFDTAQDTHGAPIAPVSGFAVDEIDTFSGFEKLRQDWERLYASDPDAEFFLSILWQGDTPLGAQAIIADGGAMYCKMAARADRADVPIGMLLEAHSIEWAIGRGFGIYDFGHGNEPYKYKYGAVDKPVSYFSITR